MSINTIDELVDAMGNNSSLLEFWGVPSALTTAWGKVKVGGVFVDLLSRKIKIGGTFVDATGYKFKTGGTLIDVV